MPVTVELSKENLVKYLQIASKQRKRAAQKFMDDYGPGSATVQEVSREIAELEMAINKINAAPTPLEEAVNKRK